MKGPAEPDEQRKPLGTSLICSGVVGPGPKTEEREAFEAKPHLTALKAELGQRRLAGLLLCYVPQPAGAQTLPCLQLHQLL